MIVEAFAARLHEGMENCRYLEQEGRDYANSFGIGHMNGKLIAGIETGGTKILARISDLGGKVVADGEHSDDWHAGYGGGVWIAPMARGNTVSLSLGQSRERRGVYLRSGFAF